MKKEEGFSIIEIVVSLFIFGIVLLIYVAAANTMTLNQSARNKQLAFRIASNEIEKLRATPYASLPTSVTVNDPLLSSLPAASASVSVNVYNPKTKVIVSTVNWKEASSSTPRSISLTTLITEGGLGQ